MFNKAKEFIPGGVEVKGSILEDGNDYDFSGAILVRLLFSMTF